MVIAGKRKEHEGLSSYLKVEHPEFYDELRRGYSEKKGAFPDMTEEQYLLHVVEATEKRARNKAKSLDDTLVNEDEIKALQKIINQSPALKEVVKMYGEVQRASAHLTKKEKEKLEKAVVADLYDALAEEDKRKYGKKNLTVYLRKLNLGPWRKPQIIGKGKNLEDYISRNRQLFRDNEDIAVRLLERAYSSEIQQERTIEDARKKLAKLSKKGRTPRRKK